MQTIRDFDKSVRKYYEENPVDKGVGRDLEYIGWTLEDCENEVEIKYYDNDFHTIGIITVAIEDLNA